MRVFAPTAFRHGGIDYPYGWQDLPQGLADVLLAAGIVSHIERAVGERVVSGIYDSADRFIGVIGPNGDEQLLSTDVVHMAASDALNSAKNTVVNFSPSQCSILDDVDTTATPKPITDMSKDGSKILSAYSRTVYESVDEGATWTAIGNNFSADEPTLQGAFYTDDGELLVSVRNDSVTHPGRFYKSTGYGSSTVNWTLVLTTSNVANYFPEYWAPSRDGNVIVVNEYGSKISGSSARYAWISYDYGNSFEIIFDLVVQLNDHSHIHMAAVDPYWKGTVWISNGDSLVGGTLDARIWVTYDYGKTWDTVADDNANLQAVTILPMQDAILMGSDSAPNGLYRIWRTPDRKNLRVDLAYVHNQLTDLNCISRYFTQRDGYPALLTFMAQGASSDGNSFILASDTGANIEKIFTGTTVYESNGFYGAWGPSAISGNALISATGVVSGTTKHRKIVIPMVEPRTSVNTLPKLAFDKKLALPSSATTNTGATVQYTPDFNTSELDLKIKCTFNVWPVLASGADMFVAHRWGTTLPDQTWRWRIRNDTGKLSVTVGNGTTNITFSASADPAITVGVPIWLRVTYQPNVAGSYNGKFYTSTDGVTWTQLGTTQTGTAFPMLATSNYKFTLGTSSTTTLLLKADVYRFIQNKTVDGFPLLDVDFTSNDWPVGTPYRTNKRLNRLDKAGKRWEINTESAAIYATPKFNVDETVSKIALTGATDTDKLASVIAGLKQLGLFV